DLAGAQQHVGGRELAVHHRMGGGEERLVEVLPPTGGGQPGVAEVEDAGPPGGAVHPALVPLGVPERDPREEQVGPEALGGAVEGAEPRRGPVEGAALAAL